MRKFEKLSTAALEIYLQHGDESDEKALLERKMTNFLITEADKPDITAVAKKLGQEIKDMLTRLPKGMNNTRAAAAKILTELGKIAMTGSDDKKDVKNAAKLVTDASAVMSKFLNAITKIMAPLELVLEKEKVDNVTFKDILNDTEGKYAALKAKLPNEAAFEAAIGKAWKPPVGFMQGLIVRVDSVVSTANAISASWKVVAVADLDGDQRADLVWRHQTRGDVVGWLMAGAVRRASATIAAGIATRWNVVDASDFNGDGRGDLLWRDSITGDVHGWLMSGLSRSASGFIRNASKEWHNVP